MNNKKGPYKYSISKEAASFVSGLSEKHRKQIAEKISFIRLNPQRQDTVKLKGSEWCVDGIQGRRIRSGDYRIIYLIYEEEHAIKVIIVDNRSDVYR